MLLRRELLAYDKPWQLPDVYLFTGNPIRRSDGAIVMGRGAARQVRDTYTRIPYTLGNLLNDQPRANLLFVEISPGQWIGWFKVKEHWRDNAEIKLIRNSVHELNTIALARPNHSFHMNMPGVGNGRLDEKTVMPILDELPDNVIIYR